MRCTGDFCGGLNVATLPNDLCRCYACSSCNIRPRFAIDSDRCRTFDGERCGYFKQPGCNTELCVPGSSMCRLHQQFQCNGGFCHPLNVAVRDGFCVACHCLAATWLVPRQTILDVLRISFKLAPLASYLALCLGTTNEPSA